MKVIIPAAWFGTRFLPWTKAMPKEMLPIVDKPVIQYVVEEIVESGLKDIIIVTGAQKRAIEDHFDMPNENLIQNLLLGNKHEYIDAAKAIADMANFYYIRQKWPYGNGTPVLCSENLIGNESFAVLRGDEFIQGTPPRLQQMLDVHRQYPDAVIISALRIANKADLKRYGIVDVTLIKDNIYEINTIVEKPNPDDAPSNLAALWAYILPPAIFSALREVGIGTGWEAYLTDAINHLKAQGTKVIAVEIKDAIYFDTGNKLEYLKTCIYFARRHPELGQAFDDYLRSILL